ncbi:MAG TPA: ATP-binding protein, partial [Vicinamibacterales bacterium]|nr:ATP-binding protein [Vicinamibacterales bacterium]
TGAGIDAALLPDIFDPFRQGQGGLTRQHGGLGLGLAVVRQLVELHGGSVSAASPGAGAGATFTIRLPRETAPEMTVESAAVILSGLRVLIVSPNSVDAAALRQILEWSGAQVTLQETIEDQPRAAADADATVTRDAETLRIRSAGAAGETSVPRSAPPAEIVRRVARAAARRLTPRDV